MDYQEYHRLTQEMNQYVEQGQFNESLEVLRTLVESDISDLDKSIMCYNGAIICGDKMKLTEDALGWYDAGIAYETPYYRCFVREHKAAYLANNGYPQEALAIYEDLMQQPYVQEADKDRMWRNIVVLRNPRPA